MKIVLIGADGQLGSDLKKVIPAQDLIPLTEKDLDITNYNLTSRVIKKQAPRVVINTAAYHKVDDCEENDLLAFSVNAQGAKNVALICREIGAELVYISTDYVFSGEGRDKPFKETDCPNPKTAYGISKLAGEFYVRYILDKHFVVRTCGLYGLAGCKGKGGGNFVETMLKLSKEKQVITVVDDQIMTPTYTYELAKKIFDLIKTQKYGVYHISNNGQCSWFDFAQKIFELTDTKIKLERIKTDQSGFKPRRPAYSVLENYNLKQLGLDDMRDWDKALAAYLKERSA